jgi:hypothetical protein
MEPCCTFKSYVSHSTSVMRMMQFVFNCILKVLVVLFNYMVFHSSVFIFINMNSVLKHVKLKNCDKIVNKVYVYDFILCKIGSE